MQTKITYPLRVGRKQNRVVLDAAGLQVAEVSHLFPELAHEFVGYMNGKSGGIAEAGEQQYQQWREQYSGFKKDSEISDLKRQVRAYEDELGRIASNKTDQVWTDEVSECWRENTHLIKSVRALEHENKELTEARDYLAKEVQEANADRSYMEQQKRELHEKITALENENFELKRTLNNSYTLSGGIVTPVDTKWKLSCTLPKPDDLGEITRKHDYRIKVLEAIIGASFTIGALCFIGWVIKTFA